MLFGIWKSTIVFSGQYGQRYSQFGYEQESLTVRRPRLLVTSQRPVALDSTNSSHLEPHIACSLPRIDVGVVGYFGHVELHRAKMRHHGVCDKPKCIACCDGRSGCPCFVLEASHIAAAHTSHPLVALIILRLPNRCPFLRFGCTVDDDF